MKAAADYMAERIDDFRLVEIHDAAHLPNMDRPEEFRQIVEDFLSDLNVSG
jgi:pimeloyl-ACP methyl ester carboxylesterase